MTKEEYIEKNKALMEKWKKSVGACKGKVSFVEDGIISPDDWFSAEKDKKKILFLLKEAFGKNDDHLIWSLPEWIRQDCTEKCGGVCATCKVTGGSFNRVAEWTQGILTDAAACDPSLGAESGKAGEYNKARESYLRKIAIVNIKKSEGQHASSGIDLLRLLKDESVPTREFLCEQIKLIEPDLIICGGTYDCLRVLCGKLPALENSRNGHAETCNIRVIAAYHPNARKKKDELYKIIRDNYVALMQKENGETPCIRCNPKSC